MRAAPVQVGTRRVPDSRRLRVEVQADMFGDYEVSAKLVEGFGHRERVLARQEFTYNAPGLGGEWAILCLEDVALMLEDLFSCAAPRK